MKVLHCFFAASKFKKQFKETKENKCNKMYN